jgi:hypothetical protein
MKIGIVVFAFLVSLFLAAVGQASHPLFFPLSQHTMCEYVGEDFAPIDRTYSFSVDDDQAISWLLIWRDNRVHNVEWRWYYPEGRTYARSFDVIPPIDGPAGYWYAPIWSCLKIYGYDAARIPGVWKVDVIVDFRKVLTEYFTIDGMKSC